MKQTELMTPAVICNLDALEGNLKRYHEAAKANGKELWPMIKTHKSTEVARMQVAAGATGFLCGNLEEAEAVSYLGKKVMLAYPVASKENIAKAIEIAKKCDFYLRLDGVEAAAMIDAQTKEAGILMLADAVESASRSLTEWTPRRVENLVRKITETRIEDGQFRDSGLTFGEVQTIQQSLVSSLLASRHTRVKYPDGDKDSKDDSRGERSDDGKDSKGENSQIGKLDPSKGSSSEGSQIIKSAKVKSDASSLSDASTILKIPH